MKNEKKDILSNFKPGNKGLSVPEGYFDDLQERLSAIPAEHPVKKASGSRAFIPAAAGMAAAVAAAAFLFTHMPTEKTDSGITMLSYDQCTIADLIPRTDPYIFFSDDIKQTDRYSDADITEYIEYLFKL